MKVTYELDMDKEEDFERKHHIDNAYKYHSVIWNFDQELRRLVKYPDVESKLDGYTLQEIRTKLHEMLNEENITQ